MQRSGELGARRLQTFKTALQVLASGQEPEGCICFQCCCTIASLSSAVAPQRECSSKFGVVERRHVAATVAVAAAAEPEPEEERMRVDAPRRMPWRMRVGVTTLLGALALFALANIQRARASQPTEPSVDFVVWDTEQTSWEGSNARRPKLGFHTATTLP